MTTPMRLLNIIYCTPGPISGPAILVTDCNGRVTAQAVQPHPTSAGSSIPIVGLDYFYIGDESVQKRE